MKRTSCEIGSPYSANQMYVPIARGKMVKNAKYRKWIEENSKILLNGIDKPTEFPVLIDILITANHNWSLKHDPDNCVKPVLDLLVSNGILPDDTNKYVESVNIRVLYFPGPPNVRISYEEPAEILFNY